MRNQNTKLYRLLALILVMSVAFSCSCSKKKDSSEESSKTEETTAGSQESASETSETTESTTETTSESTTESTTDTSVSDSSDTQNTSSGSSAAFATTFDSGKADSYLDSIKLDGVVLVAEKDQIIYTKASGYADRDSKTPNTMETVFELGSITKQFTAVAIMQLVEQGKLSLDDTLDKYIPEYKYAKDVTIHQLLNMTGLPVLRCSGIHYG